MRTIVEPQQRIDRLWGKQKVDGSAIYRIMKYVLSAECEGTILLHNVVTGQMVALERSEAHIYSNLPMQYDPLMDELIKDHFFVPKDYNEQQQVAGLRTVLRRLVENQKNIPITTYTILPTTACNARCYYCFEKGAEPITMTEQTAYDVVRFISSHCNRQGVYISWFGGEPTLASQRIDQISRGIRELGINYRSEMTTNGYAFDENMVGRAKDLWNLRSANITIDGKEETYNKIKAYAVPDLNPYRRIMRNVGMLLDQEIRVNLRMNFDLDNYQDFPVLVNELKKNFGSHKYLSIRVHPVNGEFPDSMGHIHHADSQWFSEKIVELNNIARESGYMKQSQNLPSLRFEGCEANNSSSVTITPEGMLVRCPEQFGKNQYTGNLKEGITNPQLVADWKTFIEYEKCAECVFYPRCNRLVLCNVKDRCESFLELQYLFKKAMERKFLIYRDSGLVEKEGKYEV